MLKFTLLTLFLLAAVAIAEWTVEDLVVKIQALEVKTMLILIPFLGQVEEDIITLLTHLVDLFGDVSVRTK